MKREDGGGGGIGDVGFGSLNKSAGLGNVEV